MYQEIYLQQEDSMQEQTTDSLIDDASTGAGSTTLYIGNESILASGDIGSSVQGYDQQLADVAGLTPTDGNIIIGNGANFVTESGNTARTSLGVGYSDSPSFTGVKLTGLTANRLTSTNGTNDITSVSDLTAWIAGTANRVTVSNDGDGTITLSAPQDIATNSAVTFGTQIQDREQTSYMIWIRIDTGQGANELIYGSECINNIKCNIWISKNNKKSNGRYKHINCRQRNKQGRYRDNSSNKNIRCNRRYRNSIRIRSIYWKSLDLMTMQAHHQEHHLVGLYDDSMAYISANTTVQNAIKQLDSAITDSITGDIQQQEMQQQGSVFTGGADGGNSLWFEGTTADNFEIILTGADATLSDKTITFQTQQEQQHQEQEQQTMYQDGQEQIHQEQE